MNLRHFDNFILVIILISSILLALEDPVDEEAKRNKVRELIIGVMKQRRISTSQTMDGALMTV